MNKLVKVTVIALALSILLPPDSLAVQVSDRMNGKVTDTAGKPIEGVNITAVNRGTGEIRRTATNSSGRFMLMDLQEGIYQLTFNKEGYQPVQVERSFSNQLPNRSVDVTMESAQAPGVTREEAEAAVQLVREGKFEEALPTFQKVLENDPNADWARANAGLCLGGLGRYKEALEHFEYILEKDPENITALILAANTCLSLQNAVKAEGYFERLTQLQGDDPDNWFTLGELYSYSQKREKALEAYHKTIELKEDYADAYLKIGATHQVTGNLNEAIKYLERYLELAPNSKEAGKVRTMLVEAHFEVGSRFMEELRYEDALSHLERVLELAPEGEKAEEARSMIEAIKGEMEKDEQR